MLACASFVERQWGEMVVLACDSFAWALALACGCLVVNQMNEACVSSGGKMA